jgi:hypothetical protein
VTISKEEKKKVEFREVYPTLGLIDGIVGNLRQSDRDEIAAYGFFLDLKSLIVSSSFDSRLSMVVLMNDTPVIIGGVYPAGGDVGRPWLLATTEIETNPDVRAYMAIAAKRWMALSFEHFNTLTNKTHKNNRLSKRWLTSLGFHIAPAVGEFQEFTLTK